MIEARIEKDELNFPHHIGISAVMPSSEYDASSSRSIGEVNARRIEAGKSNSHPGHPTAIDPTTSSDSTQSLAAFLSMANVSNTFSLTVSAIPFNATQEKPTHVNEKSVPSLHAPSIATATASQVEPLFNVGPSAVKSIGQTTVLDDRPIASTIGVCK